MVYEYLSDVGAIGADNAISKADLAVRLGMTEDGIKRNVNNERQRQALLICSGIRGYYIPENREEIAQFAAVQDAVAESHRMTAKPFHDALRAQEGQLDLLAEADIYGETQTEIHA